ncbi:MAG: hypothetical protein WD824_09785 [Cyclobacteriaceae bacterium]
MKMKYVFRWVVIFLGTCVAILAFAMEVSGQSHDGFLYGKVSTENNTYTGPIRWGSEELLWTDFFNAEKTTDRYDQLVPEQKNEDSWLNFDWTFSRLPTPSKLETVFGTPLYGTVEGVRKEKFSRSAFVPLQP